MRVFYHCLSPFRLWLESLVLKKILARERYVLIVIHYELGQFNRK